MILWGLDLNAIRFGAFNARRMWAPRFHLRRTRFIVYQLAMILLVVGESVATAAMSKYLDLQDAIEMSVPGVSLYQNNIVGCASFTIFAGVFTATVLGTMFFFNLFWPALPETNFWARTKLYSATFANVAVLGACISSTIVGATASAHYEFERSVTDHAAAVQAVQATGLTFPPLRYKKYNYVIVWLVFIWVGWLFTAWSNVLVYQASKFHLANPGAVRQYKVYEEELKTGRATEQHLRPQISPSSQTGLREGAAPVSVQV